MTPLGSFGIGPQPNGACSDGINFWVTLAGSLTPPAYVARF